MAEWDLDKPAGSDLVSTVDDTIRADKATLLDALGLEHQFTEEDTEAYHLAASARIKIATLSALGVPGKSAVPTADSLGRLAYATDAFSMHYGDGANAWQLLMPLGRAKVGTQAALEAIVAAHRLLGRLGLCTDSNHLLYGDGAAWKVFSPRPNRVVKQFEWAPEDKVPTTTSTSWADIVKTDYTTGTANVAALTPTVVAGAATAWLANVDPGDEFKLNADGEECWTEIASVDENGALTLTGDYPGTLSDTPAAYAIRDHNSFHAKITTLASAAALKITAMLTVSQLTLAKDTHFMVEVDGTDLATYPVALIFAQSGTSYGSGTVTIVVWTPETIAAGEHTVSIRWKVTGGTAYMTREFANLLAVEEA